MTIETRTTIEFTDIARVEFECSACHTRITKELVQQNIVPSRCRGGLCANAFFIENSTELVEFQSALDMIARYAKAKTGTFTVRLELSPSISQTSKQAQ